MARCKSGAAGSASISARSFGVQNSRGEKRLVIDLLDRIWRRVSYDADILPTTQEQIKPTGV